MIEKLGDVKAFADKVLEDKDKYADVLEKGIKGVDKAKDLLEKLKSGDREGVEVVLTQWDDVNENLKAIAAMDKAIEDAENGIELEDVLEGIVTALKVGVSLAALV
jgi:hypothetical protein